MSQRIRSQHSSELAVVGVGASAGGLEAATQLFEAWPPDPYLAFILVQHADPSGGSMLAALLAPHTALIVVEAAEGMPVEPAHLYVNPPGSYLSVDEGVLHLSAPPVRPRARMPFDFLLHSLAQRYGKRAACVVLSGTGTDGSAGVVSIKGQGGAVAVQDPAEAGYNGMPSNAIATGLADVVLPVARIPDALSARWLSRAAASARNGASNGSVTGAGAGAVNGALAAKAAGGCEAEERVGAGLPDILALLRSKTSNDFALYKPGTLRRRVGRRIALAGLKLDDMAGYLEMLRADPAELQALARDLLIHVTSFFRDPGIFETLAAKTIPELVAAHPADQQLRVWVAGCSTGEETYSLAMLLLEQIDAGGRPMKLQVFGSDVDAEAIAAARDGAYPATIEEDVTAERLARFFVREESGWRVGHDLRAAIVFTVQDLLTDPPFSRLDMVSCRNLLIYLRPDAQARVIDAFHFALRNGGILLLGSAEGVVGPEGRFEPVENTERIYRRVGHDALAKRELPPRLATLFDLARPGEERRSRLPPAAAAARPAALAELGRRLVLEAYAPASLLIDAADDVLFSLGPTDRYLRLAPGYATQDVLAMARPGLRAKLRTALQAARADKKKALVSGWITGGDASQPFSVAVHPVTEGDQDLLLVCFLDVPRPEPDGDVPHPPGGAPRIGELQRELEATRTELQGTVRDLELSAEEQRAINEEALSVNEEFQSTNQELVASQEELQSLNEELRAANSQLQETLEHQRTTSDDLQNVLFSTNVATLFLDLDGRIRFFTPAIRSLFAIIPNDVGRKLADFAALVPDAALIVDLKAVQDGQEPPDREIEAPGGTWFRRRILPYRASGGRVEGEVITYTDITGRKMADRALEAAKMEAEAANVAKSRFLAAASHDLRQPLQTLTLLQALLADTVTSEKALSLLARQTVTLSTVTGMLDTLLDINEIEAGAVQPDVSTFDVGGLLERLRGEFAYHAEAKGIELRVIACGQHVRSDKRLLEQMVRNLLSNAIKYTVKGRVLLGCRRHSRKAGGDLLSLEVLDTGIGIDTAELASIFEEYYQVGNPARQRSSGLGLGLSIVKRLGDLLGHSVRVRSRPGSGSEFSIELPLAPQAELKRGDLMSPEATSQGAALNILVVEDDPELGEMLGAVLAGLGHAVTTVPDGPAALESLAHGTPELVLADYNLPNGPNGLELAAMIRAVAGRPVPVLILTGDISNATLRAVTDAGCAVLSKPAGVTALRKAITSLLLPPPASLQPSSAKSLQEPGSRPGHPVIFVVDDDGVVRGALMAMLEADGRTVEGYPSGEAFLEAFRPGAGDCLLIDAALPGISGIDLLERLRAAGHSLPVIVVTGQSDVPMAIRAMKAGASDFIEKPVGRAGLLASIARALEGSHDSAKLVAQQEAAAAQVAGLTPRQREIMTLVLAGQPSKNIAADLGISQRTVENHRASIMQRTGAASLPALARLALVANSSAAID